jgi:oxygen-independent coproporphyrinogen-3 oxidase
MMNALRLRNGAPRTYLKARTGKDCGAIEKTLESLSARGLISDDPERLVTTELGYRHLDSVIEAFF